ncbi:MAG: DNA internalization-related competence protein ComEC/Rec2 [Ruminococcaceae bacterium]|nr:DNA internalization-related competence protein ComEC/Rec2 [Oscillospiraceae bacterium]
MNVVVAGSLFTVIGIIISLFLIPTARMLLCSCTLLSLVLYRLKTRKAEHSGIVFVFAMCLIAGVLCVNLCDLSFENLENSFCDESTMQGRIVGFAETESYGETVKYADIRVKRIGCNGNEKRINKLFRLNISDIDESLYYGDMLTFRATPHYYEEPYNFGEFNYKRYMQSRGYAGTCGKPQKLIIRRAGFYLPKIFYYTAEYIKKMIHSHVGGESADLVCGILIGDKSGFSERLSENISLAGISHITAVSGMHTSVLILFILWLSNIFTKRRKTKAYAVIAVLVFYMFMTGLSPSVVRASLMAMSTMAGLIMGRRGRASDTLVILATAMLVINPNLLFSPSFMLSFLATFGMITFMPLIATWKAASSPFIQTLLITVFANVTTLPYVLWNFGMYSWIGVLVNIIVVPLIAYIFVGGMLTVFFGPVPLIGKLFGLFTRFLASLIIGVTGFVSEIPVGQMRFPKKNLLFVAAYIIFALMCYIAVKNRKSRGHFRYLPIAFVMCILLGYAADFADLNTFSVSFVYVGHGDCALVNLPGGRKILIDTGDSQNGRSSCAQYLSSEGISHIESVLISHSDSDHCGALENVLAKICADRIYVTDYSDKAGMNGKIYEAAEKYGCPVKTVSAGYKMKSGGAEFEIISPGKNGKNLSENDSSMVIKLTYGGKIFVFTGDISESVENAIADRIGKCDVLKIAHHGSETSTSQHFLNVLAPRYAVVSAGAELPYQYSKDKIRQKLQKNLIKGYYTYSHGTVKFAVSKNGSMSVRTKRGEYINAKIERQSTANGAS